MPFSKQDAGSAWEKKDEIRLVQIVQPGRGGKTLFRRDEPFAYTPDLQWSAN